MIQCTPSTAKPPQANAPQELQLFVCPFTIIQDSREQAPWTFQNIVIEKKLWVIRRVVKTMKTGDYTIEGYEDRLCLERKSVSDLIQSVTREHDREARKQSRMRDIQDAGGFSRMIIEGSFSSACDELDADESRGVSSGHILGTWKSWEIKYIPWLWAGDRRRAELIAFHLMLEWWKTEQE